MTIRSNIDRVMQSVREDQTDGSIGKDIQRKAVQAIRGGEGSGEWQKYMQMFAETPEQLARLLPTDKTKDVEDMDTARTYLLGNGTCGAETTGFRLIFGIDDKLDDDLSQ